MAPKVIRRVPKIAEVNLKTSEDYRIVPKITQRFQKIQRLPEDFRKLPKISEDYRSLPSEAINVSKRVGVIK